jgi:hypothetical protein
LWLAFPFTGRIAERATARACGDFVWEYWCRIDESRGAEKILRLAPIDSADESRLFPERDAMRDGEFASGVT